MAVDDEAGDLVGLVGNHGFLQELAERDVGERHPRRDHLLGGVGGDPGQPVAGARRRRPGKEVAQVREGVGRCVDGMAVDQGSLRGASAGGRPKTILKLYLRIKTLK
ncbi:hypothetical protein ABH988_003579 [Bradyrhizobium ottawaense]